MEKIIYEEKKPTAQQYQMLRESVGWSQTDPEKVDIALKNTLFCVCAYHTEGGGRSIIGSGRVVGDGALSFYIQDVMVIPEFQRTSERVGFHLMNEIMHYINSNASSYSDIGGMASKGVEPFYEQFGFTKRPDNELGSGMTYKMR